MARLFQSEALVGAAAGGGGVGVVIPAPTPLDDRLIGRAGDDRIVGLAGDDVISGRDGDDRLAGGRGDDALFGGRGKDRLEGGRGDDRLDGGRGDDRLEGGAGRDRLEGGIGEDVLIGGRGRDRLFGGADEDVFRFDSAAEAGVGRGRDVIGDFGRGDVIDLSRIDANPARAGDQAFRFIGEEAFSDRPAELRYSNGVLRGDLDGDGRADFQVALAGAPELRAGDLLL